MLKQPSLTLHKTTRTEITSLFGEAKLVLDETPKAISPFGGLASFISFLGQIGFARQVQPPLPFAEPTSNNAIPLAHSLRAFLMSVVVGARRFAHGGGCGPIASCTRCWGWSAFRVMTRSATSSGGSRRRTLKCSGGRSGAGGCCW
jgi:hypothetical protein